MATEDKLVLQRFIFEIVPIQFLVFLSFCLLLIVFLGHKFFISPLLFNILLK